MLAYREGHNLFSLGQPFSLCQTFEFLLCLNSGGLFHEIFTNTNQIRAATAIKKQIKELMFKFLVMPAARFFPVKTCWSPLVKKSSTFLISMSRAFWLAIKEERVQRIEMVKKDHAVAKAGLFKEVVKGIILSISVSEIVSPPPESKKIALSNCS